MKTLTLSALVQLKLEDLNVFLPWLASLPVTEVSLSQLKKSPPIRSNKVTFVLKLLEELGMISNKKERVSITPTGRAYASADLTAKTATLRSQLLSVEPVRRIQDLLESSDFGRVHKRAIHDSFDLGARNRVQDAEVLAFIGWAEACELFTYDKKKQEIVRIDVGRPGPDNDPRQPGPGEPGMRLAS